MSGSLFVVAGEMSGDAHAAGLLEALLRRRPGLRVAGAGGPKLRAVAGDGVRDWVDQAGVMGVVEVLKHYSWFKQQFHDLLAEVRELRPEVLLLVDYPGFNLRFAAAVREALPRTRIVQYVCPQVWAWKKGRIPKMAQLLDEVLCLLPFEPEVFAGTGLKANFVGHPMIDELETERIEVERDAGLVALMPGSREPEVRKLFPMMLDAAARLRADHPQVRFEAPAANGRMRRVMEEFADERLAGLVTFTDGGAHSLMQRAACGVIASGTATVEAAYFRLPYCLVYKLAWPTYLIAKMVVKIEHIGLVNILAGREVVEEFVQSEADPCHVGRSLSRFLGDPRRVEEVRAGMAESVAMLGGRGAHERAAAAVEAWFGSEGGAPGAP